MAAKKVVSTTYLCAQCGRKLKRWIYSAHTKKRYCMVGEGCGKRWATGKRQ